MLDTSNGTTDADLKSIGGTITSTKGTACSVYSCLESPCKRARAAAKMTPGWTSNPAT
ncbi:hypothetical protein NC652_017407 [Populus alba x Populus x berolinensis]|nr:hypothetical protein NC652_017407 [Populus alba x Populus x berolinensis]